MRARIWDIWRRAETGPICPVKRFDTRVYWPRLKEVVKEYGIQYDPEIIVPTDDTLIDDVYRAAMKLLLDVGVPCLDTERIIQLEEGEVKEMLRNKPRQVTLGEGKDAVTIVHRDLEDRRPPRILGRILGKITEGVALKVYQSFAQEPIIDIINPQPTFTLLEGLPIKAGSPFEMHAEICNLAYVRTALRRAGRPGMPLFGSPSATDTSNIGGVHRSMGGVGPMLDLPSCYHS